METIQYDTTYFERKTLDELNAFMTRHNCHMDLLPVIEDNESLTDYNERYRKFVADQLKKRFLIKKK